VCVRVYARVCVCVRVCVREANVATSLLRWLQPAHLLAWPADAAPRPQLSVVTGCRCAECCVLLSTCVCAQWHLWSSKGQLGNQHWASLSACHSAGSGASLLCSCRDLQVCGKVMVAGRAGCCHCEATGLQGRPQLLMCIDTQAHVTAEKHASTAAGFVHAVLPIPTQCSCSATGGLAGGSG
jgi:hypothetical protein